MASSFIKPPRKVCFFPSGLIMAVFSTKSGILITSSGKEFRMWELPQHLDLLFILASLVKKIYRRSWKTLLLVTDNYFLNMVFWASFAALLYSFGLPFILGLEFLVEYLGPLQQIRSIGRFTWLFYFAINLVVFYRYMALAAISTVNGL